MEGKLDIGSLRKQLLDDYLNSLNQRESKITIKKCKKIAKFILNQETDFNLPETKYSLLLHFVLQNGDKNTFKLVLKKGKNFDINAQDLKKRTILYYALYKNEAENKEAFLKHLFDYGALIDVGEGQEELQNMVTKYALKEILLVKKNAVSLDLLIRRGFDIHSRGDVDNRPFLKLLEESKRDDNKALNTSESNYHPYGDSENNTDLDFHQRATSVKMIELLVHNFEDMNATNSEGGTGGVETDDQQRLRFQVELEFVQCLANPNYLNFLAQRNHLKDPNFINYLKYLLYWKEPEYAKYLKYPMCLYFLDLLQHEHFRREVVNSQCTKFIDDQQILLWQHYTRRRTRLLQTAAEQTQNVPPQNNGIIQPKVL